MDAHEYLTFAESLAKSAKDNPTLPNFRGVCRSAISRAYYALFLLAREFVDGLGIETRQIPNPHVTLEQALQNSGVFSLERIAETLGRLRSDRTDADYDMRNTDVETIAKVEEVIEAAKFAIVQLDIIRAGKLTPPPGSKRGR
ncbi:MAG: hypothetical protein L0241_17220 [Planctomycetia bacterium]|nr:hypothetical protein [Planctomycetia bacterium]